MYCNNCMEVLAQTTNWCLGEDLSLSKESCNSGKGGGKEEKRIASRKVDGLNFSVDACTVERTEGRVKDRLLWRNLFM